MSQAGNAGDDPLCAFLAGLSALTERTGVILRCCGTMWAETSESSEPTQVRWDGASYAQMRDHAHDESEPSNLRGEPPMSNPTKETA